MAFAVFSYAIGNQYIEDPHYTALGIIFLTMTLLSISFVITRSFERMAEATRMKTEFVSIVSHQLRSPLSNMTWSLDFLTSEQKEIAKEKQDEYLQILQTNTSRMADLVKDLLLVSQLEESTLHTKKETFSLRELIDEILKSMSPSLRARRIQVEVKEQGGPFAVSFDELQLRHVMANLIDNAARYSFEGEVVTITLERKGKNLRFSISDKGIGIPDEDQKHMFQKFFRSPNARKYQIQGSGLGLYIARSIIQKGGGQMGFTSKEYKGSTFWFTIPLQQKATL